MKKLSVSNIKHSYDSGQKVLDDVSFDVAAGELACIVGPSGCGKSTLLRLISGLEVLQGGSIRLGEDVLASDKVNVPVQKRNIGLVFQNPSLFPHLDVRENIAFGLKKQSSDERDRIVDDLLDVIGLKEFEARYPHTLSGGQQQRVSLARSLAKNPSVMLLDEPFANLDYSLRRDLASEVIDVLKDANIPVIMVTHDPEEVLSIADKMILLGDKGGVRQIGEPDDVYDNPVDAEAASFFGTINKVEGKIDGDLVRTAIGDFSKDEFCPSIKDKSEVLLMFRPEGVKLSSSEKGSIRAKVEKIIRTAKGYNVSVSVGEEKLTFFVSDDSKKLLEAKEAFFQLDSNRVFVF